MDHKEPQSTPTELDNGLVLVDDDLIQQKLSNLPDLYFQLVKEPSFIKKQSLKYDYQPSPLAFVYYEEKIGKIQEIENHSEIGNTNLNTVKDSTQTTKGIKCNCSKTKCQKNYCECFKAGISCGPQCSCTECCNDQLSLSIQPKKTSGAGCKCQKSHCTKNYCQCHNGGRKCTAECRCVECQNMVQHSHSHSHSNSNSVSSNSYSNSNSKGQAEEQEGHVLGKPKKKVKRTKIAQWPQIDEISFSLRRSGQTKQFI